MEMETNEEVESYQQLVHPEVNWVDFEQLA